jgi:hypothetical protein
MGQAVFLLAQPQVSHGRVHSNQCRLLGPELHPIRRDQLPQPSELLDRLFARTGMEQFVGIFEPQAHESRGRCARLLQRLPELPTENLRRAPVEKRILKRVRLGRDLRQPVRHADGGRRPIRRAKKQARTQTQHRCQHQE